MRVSLSREGNIALENIPLENIPLENEESALSHEKQHERRKRRTERRERRTAADTRAGEMAGATVGSGEGGDRGGHSGGVNALLQLLRKTHAALEVYSTEEEQIHVEGEEVELADLQAGHTRLLEQLAEKDAVIAQLEREVAMHRDAASLLAPHNAPSRQCTGGACAEAATT
jgi:hypothetical protein